MKLFTTTLSLNPSLPHRLPILLPKMSRPYNKTNNQTRGRRNDDPTVALSKSLSWILRHGLDKSGLNPRSDGYVRLDALVPPFCQTSTNVAHSSQIPKPYRQRDS